MRHRSPRAAAALTLVATALAVGRVPLAVAQDQPRPVDLRMKITPGTQVTFERVFKFTAPDPAGGAGQIVNVDKRSATVTCLAAAANGRPTDIRVQFAADCGQTTTKPDGTAPQAQPFALAGKTVRITLDPSGAVRIDANGAGGGGAGGGGADGADPAGGAPAGGDLGPQVTSELTSMIYGDHALMPGHPVAVGDAWTSDPTVALREAALPDGSTVANQCKLTGVGTAAGRPVAEVAITTDISLRVADGSDHKVAVTGTAVFDLATGVAVKFDSTGTMDLGGGGGGAMGQPAAQANVESHLVQRVTTAARPPAPDDGGGGILGRLAGGGGNGQADPSARFAGTFKNDRLTLTLAPAGGGRLSGSFAKGANSFPAQARVDGDRLTGTFTAAGTAYDFTATADGSGLHLSSNGKDYDLQKVAAPAAPNPLDGN